MNGRQTVISIDRLKPALDAEASDGFSLAPIHQLFEPQKCTKQPLKTNVLTSRYELKIHFQTLL